MVMVSINTQQKQNKCLQSTTGASIAKFTTELLSKLTDCNRLTVPLPPLLPYPTPSQSTPPTTTPLTRHSPLHSSSTTHFSSLHTQPTKSSTHCDRATCFTLEAWLGFNLTDFWNSSKDVCRFPSCRLTRPNKKVNS
jgi:hypothetical protein